MRGRQAKQGTDQILKNDDMSLIGTAGKCDRGVEIRVRGVLNHWDVFCLSVLVAQSYV